MEKKKTRIMLILSVLVCVMAVGYAVLAQQLNIKGRASIDSTWRVEITKITEKDQLGGASSKEVPNYTATTANFNVGLVQPGDTISYEVEISNLGTLNAKVDSINVVMDENEAIKYTVSGVTEGDKLAAGSKTTLTVKVEYDSSVTTQPSKVGKDITVTVNYVQDVAGVDTPTYTAYTIGDRIVYKGINWRVLNNSDTSQDYVTLLREWVIGGPMPFYTSDTCNSENTTGCTTDYNLSTIKTYLEGTYLPYLDEVNLKEVNGSKIRLLDYNDLNILGYHKPIESAGSIDNVKEVPSWIYTDFATETYYINEAYHVDGMDGVYTIFNHSSSNGGSFNPIFPYMFGGVRPVINLLKTSIDPTEEANPDQTASITATI